MRWTKVTAIAAAIGLAIGLGLGGACGSKSTGGVDAAAIDAAGSGIDGPPGGADARTGDGGAAGVVACGTLTAPTTCPLPEDRCCYFPPGGGTDTCVPASGGTCVGAPLACDGPEDCNTGERCCYKAGVGASCTAGPDCSPGGSGGQILCHMGDDTPCAPNGKCCPLATVAGGPPIGACRVGTCPP